MSISVNFGDETISLFTVVTGVGDELYSEDWTGFCGESGIKVVDSCRIFSTKWSDTFRTFFAYGKEQESQKKNVITVQEKSPTV